MQSNWRDVTLGDVGRGVARYRPFLALAAASFLLVAVFPGVSKDDGDNLAATAPPGATAVTEAPIAGEATVDASAPGAEPVVEAGAAGTVAAGAAPVRGTAGGAVAKPGQLRAGDPTGPAAGRANATETGGSGALPVAEGVGPDCDPKTGRVQIPSKFAPPCKPQYAAGTNGGATYPGVSAETINVVAYRGQGDPATTAALKAANAADEEPDTRETLKRYVEILQNHYETYGRKVVLSFKEGSAKATDDAAGKADAIDIATRMKAFAVIGAPNNAFVDELVARKVLCICTTSQPQSFYEARAPYAGYTTLMSSTQGYIQRAEYVGKRLAGAKAQYAGDALYKTQTRKFALLYFETTDRAYEEGAKFFEKEMKEKYNVTLAANLPYIGTDVNAVQSQSGPLIQKLKDEGVNSLIFSGDPISPAIFTKEATKQGYNPEWIVTGSALVDTSLFGRTYDPIQWKNAFGISFLTARVPPTKGDAYRVYNWHRGTNEEPPAGNTYPVIYSPVFTLFTGIHMAGVNLTPSTFQQGLFSYPVSGGGLTLPTLSFGDHGLWPKDSVKFDMTGYDDVTEIWWDPEAQGPDEVGNEGVGMYRYVAGGLRYRPNEHPRKPAAPFVKEGTVVIYSDAPAGDKPPDYEHKHFRG